MTKQLKYICSALVLAFGIATSAQETANASGGDATGSGGTVAYSVGQVFYTAHTGSTGSVLQGVQHAFEIFTLSINEPALKISLIAFPNPTTGRLTLQISDYNNQKLFYQLFDQLGKFIHSGKIEAHQTQIDMNNLSSATYFINIVNQDNKTVQSFKILKH